MTQLTLREYLSHNRVPSKIICIDSKTTYHRIYVYQAYLPEYSSLIVDHVEIEPDCMFKDVVFVCDPDGMKVG